MELSTPPTLSNLSLGLNLLVLRRPELCTAPHLVLEFLDCLELRVGSIIYDIRAQSQGEEKIEVDNPLRTDMRQKMHLLRQVANLLLERDESALCCSQFSSPRRRTLVHANCHRAISTPLLLQGLFYTLLPAFRPFFSRQPSLHRLVHHPGLVGRRSMNLLLSQPLSQVSRVPILQVKAQEESPEGTVEGGVSIVPCK